MNFIFYLLTISCNCPAFADPGCVWQNMFVSDWRDMKIFTDLLAPLFKVKECLSDTPGALRLAHDQNVQFLRLGQFLSNFKG